VWVLSWETITKHNFSLRQIIEKRKEFGVDTHHFFVDFKDFKEPYFNIYRSYLALEKTKVLNKLVKLGKPH